MVVTVGEFLLFIIWEFAIGQFMPKMNFGLWLVKLLLAVALWVIFDLAFKPPRNLIEFLNDHVDWRHAFAAYGIASLVTICYALKDKLGVPNILGDSEFD